MNLYWSTDSLHQRHIVHAAWLAVHWLLLQLYFLTKTQTATGHLSSTGCMSTSKVVSCCTEHITGYLGLESLNKKWLKHTLKRSDDSIAKQALWSKESKVSQSVSACCSRLRGWYISRLPERLPRTSLTTAVFCRTLVVGH